MSKKNHEAYSLFRKKTPSGMVWYIKFWNNVTRRYGSVKSTSILVEGKRERRREAEEAAQKLLASFEEKGAFSEVARKPLIQFLLDFWTVESEYAREKRVVEKKPLSLSYIAGSHQSIKKHVETFPDFQGLTVGALTRAKLRAWKLWAAEQGMSGRKINIVLQAMRVPVRDAYRDEKIPSDPFLNIGEAAHTKKEKGVLSPAEVSAIIKSEMKNPRWRLAVLLACLCGMRRGEIRGLQWGAIGEGVIAIRCNYIANEGLKPPKCGSQRTVPFTGSVQAALDAVRNTSKNITPETFIFEQLDTPGIPAAEGFFRHALYNELTSIGIPGEWPRWKKEKAPEGYINEQKRRNLTFHSLRHSFITMSRMAGITDVEIQALAGHRDGRMMENYTHVGQILDFSSAREKLEKALQAAAG